MRETGNFSGQKKRVIDLVPDRGSDFNEENSPATISRRRALGLIAEGIAESVITIAGSSSLASEAIERPSLNTDEERVNAGARIIIAGAVLTTPIIIALRNVSDRRKFFGFAFSNAILMGSAAAIFAEKNILGEPLGEIITTPTTLIQEAADRIESVIFSDSSVQENPSIPAPSYTPQVTS